MTVSQMLVVHNELAKNRGTDPIKAWKGSHVQLAQRVAILRTQKVIEQKAKVPTKRSAQRHQPRRDAILKQLAIIDHYEEIGTRKKLSVRVGRKRPPGTVISVGLPYSVILKNLKAKHGTPVLRLTASKVRAGVAGHEKCKLPDKRPHGAPKGKR